MAGLDFHTLQVASISCRLAFIFVFLVTLLRQPGEIYFAIWAGALVCSLVASFLMLGDPSTVPLGLGKGVIVYALYGASFANSWVGLRLFYGRPVEPLQFTALVLAPGAVYGVVPYAGAPMSWSLTAVFVTVAAGAGACVVEILRPSPPARLWTQYIVVTGFVGYLVALLLSIVVVHVAGERFASPESGVYSLVFDQWCGVFIQVGYLAMVSERANLKLARLSETDPLTGLTNRRGLFKVLGRRDGRDSPAPCRAVLLADIDHFKSINDTYGHEGGDAVLVGFAERLRSVMREEDIVARWGGEEFLVLLDRADTAAASAVAERLRKAVAGRSFMLGDAPVAVTTSVGISVLGTDEARIDAAVARADAALYAAKRSGRNQVCANWPPVPRKPDVETPLPDPAIGLSDAVKAIQTVGQSRSEFA